ncbi:MAG TPA: biotin transporter BioY [Anaerolineales bacterium]|nr:biotin transporter BioY [Anaerolineales bacterium]HRQ92621.1 biotin transporter BioY [Anaerolineales bacterium]
MQQVLAERILPRRTAVADGLLILLGSLFIAALAQVRVPLQPVPITGQTLAVLLVGMALGSRRGVLAVLAYLAMGAAGLPFFTGAQSGIAYMSGATGGYLAGFIVAAALVGWLAERGWDRTLLKTLAAMVLGNLAIYALGVSWLAVLVGGYTGPSGSIALGLVPFLLGDLIKALIAALLLPMAWMVLNEKP